MLLIESENEFANERALILPWRVAVLAIHMTGVMGSFRKDAFPAGALRSGASLAQRPSAQCAKYGRRSLDLAIQLPQIGENESVFSCRALYPGHAMNLSKTTFNTGPEADGGQDCLPCNQR